MSQIFKMLKPDYERSPYTGMTREEWIRAGKHLLRGVFQNIKSAEDPVVMPRKETRITYPHAQSSGLWQEAERRAEIFEGLCRSLFIAAPLLKNEPGLELCGYSIADYYKQHILRACTPGDSLSVGSYEELYSLTKCEDPFRPFQQTVETCALVIGLWSAKEAIWDRYSKEEKDIIAAFLSSFAHKPTVPQNWRLFNMLDLAFLHMNGYPIDEEIMTDHANEILAYYAGDGWYRDGHCFDYYSCWAFQVYAPIWNKWYAYEHAPQLAKRFEENSNRLMETYPDFFDEDAFVNMWGRSNIYRAAASSALEANFHLKSPAADHGLARRICSGSLLQFLQREDFYFEGIPTMGFYGQFAPLVQGYSCAESPLWMGKVFLCLDLPADHPFWTAKENNGSWDRLQGLEVKTTTLDGPALCFSNHKANGTTVLRTGKIVKKNGDEHAMWNYSKLAYSTKYPWESTPLTEENDKTAMESQQYVLTDGSDGSVTKCNVTFWGGEEKGILYRRQFFDYNLERECTWMQAVSLADFALPYGLLRADRIRLFRKPVTITLGSWGFPDNGTQVEVREASYENGRTREAKAKAMILKGEDSLGREKQLAMTIYDGWDELKLRHSCGTNPESEKSLVVYAQTGRSKLYGAAEPYLLICQMLTKESTEDFRDEELFAIERIEYPDPYCSGGSGCTRLYLKNKEVKEICFDGLEGHLQL